MNILKSIKKILQETEDLEIYIDINNIKEEDHLRDDLEFDSLTIMTLFSELQELYPKLDESSIANWFSVKDIIDSIQMNSDQKNNLKLCSETLPLVLYQDNKVLELEEKENIIASLKEKLEKIPRRTKIFFSNSDPLNFTYTFLMALDMELVPVPLSHQMTDYQLESIRLQFNESSFLINGTLYIGTDSFEEQNEYSYGCLTSGTTGNSKIYYFNLDNALTQAKSHCKSILLDSEKHLIQTLPLYHSFGIVTYLLAWLTTKCELHLKSNFLGLNQHEHKSDFPIFLYTSPVQFRFIIKEKLFTNHNIDSITIGSASIDQKSITTLQQIKPDIKIYTTYGLTEAGPRVSTGRYRDHKNGYIGKQIQDVQVAIRSEQGMIKDNGTGQLLVKTPFKALNLPSKLQFDEYILTRDHVSINKDGEIYFHSRENDLINIGGVSIYPKDIEQVCINHDKVTDAIVLKEESTIYGEIPILIVETNITDKEVKNFIKNKLTVHQIPKKILTLETFPRTSLNKIDRKSILEIYQDRKK